MPELIVAAELSDGVLSMMIELWDNAPASVKQMLTVMQKEQERRRKHRLEPFSPARSTVSTVANEVL